MLDVDDLVGAGAAIAGLGGLLGADLAPGEQRQPQTPDRDERGSLCETLNFGAPGRVAGSMTPVLG